MNRSNVDGANQLIRQDMAQGAMVTASQALRRRLPSGETVTTGSEFIEQAHHFRQQSG